MPRNPTGSKRQAGAPPLSTAEWETLRAWQRREIKRWTYTPAAIARRKRVMAEFEAGRVAAIGSDVFVASTLIPDPPLDLEIVPVQPRLAA